MSEGDEGVPGYGIKTFFKQAIKMFLKKAMKTLMNLILANRVSSIELLLLLRG